MAVWGSERLRRMQSQASSAASSLLPSILPFLGEQALVCLYSGSRFKEKRAAASSGKVAGRSCRGGQIRHKDNEGTSMTAGQCGRCTENNFV